MNVALLILDSLSYETTPFGGEQKTMPKFQELADREGIVFESAYVPGPSSPSSHASFLTGLYPSEAGMYEASPYLPSNKKTLPGYLENHESHLLTSNPFLLNGLDREFDEVEFIDGTGRVFEGASHPKDFMWDDQDSLLGEIWELIREDGAPVRSFLNGFFNKFQSRKYTYSEEINEKIRSIIGGKDSLVVANYNDVHAPLDASSESISVFTDKEKEEMPIGVRGHKIREKIERDSDYDGQDMYDLYKAAIRDLDCKLAPLLNKLISEEWFVVVTADHGNWFRRKKELEEKRIHVPLVVFDPQRESKTVSRTVNIKDIFSTIIQRTEGENYSLLDGDSDDLSLTEFIHDPESVKQPVSTEGAKDHIYWAKAVKGNTKLEYVNGEFNLINSGDHDVEVLKDEIKEKEKSFNKAQNDDEEIDELVKNRLKDLGYR